MNIEDIISNFCKANVIVSIDHKTDDNFDCGDYDPISFLKGKIEAYNSVIVYINHLIESKSK